jgi:hypothetical protein
MNTISTPATGELPTAGAWFPRLSPPRRHTTRQSAF